MSTKLEILVWALGAGVLWSLAIAVGSWTPVPLGFVSAVIAIVLAVKALDNY